MNWLAGAAIARVAVVQIAAVAFVVGAGSGALATWKVLDWRASKAELSRQTAAFDQYRSNEHKGDDASASYQKDTEHDRTKFRTVYRTVEKIVDRPVYRNVCLDDDGVRAINDALGEPGAAR